MSMLSKEHTDMKKNILNTLFLAAVACLSFVACKDEPYKYEMTAGKPEILYIRPAGVAKDTLLTEAYMGSSLCIVGNNLRSTYKVFFNDQEAILNTSYITDNTMLLDVPNTIPGEVSNKIYFVTKQDETTEIDFKVQVPGPVITGMDCEWLPEGATTNLVGDFFIDDPNVPITLTFEGGVKAQITNISKNILTFVIPEGAKEGPVTVSTIYGSASSSFYYKDSRGMLFDFDTDPRLVCHGWHNKLFIGEDETSLSGNYLRLGDGSAEMNPEIWNDGQFSFEYWPGDWDLPLKYEGAPRLTDIVDFSDWGKMSLKFEICVPSTNVWSAGAMQIIFAGVDKITYSDAKKENGDVDIYGEAIAGANNTFFNNNELPRGIYQPWVAAENGVFTTDDKWITVTIPFANFMYGSDGTIATGSLTAKDFTSLTIFVWKGPAGEACTPVIKIDNIRAVPNK